MTTVIQVCMEMPVIGCNTTAVCENIGFHLHFTDTSYISSDKYFYSPMCIFKLQERKIFCFYIILGTFNVYFKEIKITSQDKCRDFVRILAHKLYDYGQHETLWEQSDYTTYLQCTTYCSTLRHYRICCFGPGCCRRDL